MRAARGVVLCIVLLGPVFLAGCGGKPQLRSLASFAVERSDDVCVVSEDGILVDAAVESGGRIFILSNRGDVVVRAEVRTLDAPRGIAGPVESARHGGHASSVYLFAPNGTVRVEATLMAGNGGRGADLAENLTGTTPPPSDGKSGRSFWGGFGGFGGEIFLGGKRVDADRGSLAPGSGGHAGNATVLGVVRADLVRGGNGGTAGQVYELNEAGTRDVMARLNCDDVPDSPADWPRNLLLNATVRAPSQWTCVGGHGGNATATGALSTDPTGVAGLVAGGLGGWGCPGGPGGDARSFGFNSTRGRDGANGTCQPTSGRDGEHGVPGETGGPAGVTYGGDGGVGGPGRDLEGSTMPPAMVILYGFGGDRGATMYGSPPEEGVADGPTAPSNLTFPIKGPTDRFVGGAGGSATAQGGKGGDGGRGGNGGDHLVLPGSGGTGGKGAGGGRFYRTEGGWGAPGPAGGGMGGRGTAMNGADGLDGTAGTDGRSGAVC